MQLTTNDQRTLLLYFEDRLVNNAGRVDQGHINDEGRKQADVWNEAGLIGFGRIVARDCTKDGALWVTFSGDAWEAAHKERRARAVRCWKERQYQTTAEKRACRGA